MKKILICVLLLFCLTSCSKEDKKDYKKEVVDYSSNLTKYELEAQMEVVKSEGNITFSVVVSYLEPNYYKVRLQNKSNNNIQVIVKNNDGVFVITPALNKQFQFKSDWPLNSSHAYLLQSIIKDITNDPEVILTTNSDTYSLKSLTNNKINAKMKFQTATFNKKTNHLISNVISDASGNPLVSVNVTKFNPDANLKVNDFNPEVINNTIKLEMSEGELDKSVIECVPTFIPEGYVLANSLIKDTYTVFKYQKELEFYTITVIETEVSEVLTVSREFSDVVILDSGVGFINDNSLSFFQENLYVSIYNTAFNLEEAIDIANSFKDQEN